MKKRVILMSAVFTLAIGASFAGGGIKSGDLPIYSDANQGAPCPEISGCTATVTANLCTSAETGYANSDCTDDVTAYKP